MQADQRHKRNIKLLLGCGEAKSRDRHRRRHRRFLFHCSYVFLWVRPVNTGRDRWNYRKSIAAIMIRNKMMMISVSCHTASFKDIHSRGRRRHIRGGPPRNGPAKAWGGGHFKKWATVSRAVSYLHRASTLSVSPIWKETRLVLTCTCSRMQCLPTQHVWSASKTMCQ